MGKNLKKNIYTHTHIYITESVCVYLKLTQHCKLTLFQFFFFMIFKTAVLRPKRLAAATVYMPRVFSELLVWCWRWLSSFW